MIVSKDQKSALIWKKEYEKPEIPVEAELNKIWKAKAKAVPVIIGLLGITIQKSGFNIFEEQHQRSLSGRVHC